MLNCSAEMEGIERADLDKEFGHHDPMPDCLNPSVGIDEEKILEERCEGNPVEPREDEDVPSLTVTVDTAEPIPLLEDINYSGPYHFRNMEVRYDNEHLRRVRNMFIKLETLYIYEYRYLIHCYQMLRSQFLSNEKSDDELYGPLKKSKWDNKEEYDKYCEFKQLTRYGKMTTGIESVVFETAKKKKTLNNKNKPRPFPRCAFSEMHVRCKGLVLPKSKFCLKHILSDHNQVLFRACNIVQSNNICHEPILNFGSESTCVLHEKFPKLRDL